MKKIFVLLALLVLVVPVGGTFGQAGEEWADPLTSGVERPSRGITAVSGQRDYFTHPEFTNVMTTTVNTAAQNTGDGYLFVAPLGVSYDGPSALMILDNEGEPVYIKTFVGDPVTADFKKQTVNGVDYLTYQTTLDRDGSPYGYSVVLDENYQVVDTWSINNGFADVHDFILLENGHAILLAYSPIPYDLSPWGGPVDGSIIEVVLEEQDASKNVVFEWRATEHLPVGDSQVNLNSPDVVDFLHTNAIEVDDDGNWLLSHRHFSEVTKINRQTGEVMWRLGGAGNEFTFTNDMGFSFQHDIRRLANGHITIFDNGNFHDPSHSRAVEYAIDEVNKTVTRVWQYPDDTGEFSFAMGNHQRLPNGNALIGWGTTPKFTEVEPDGTVAFEVLMGAWNYRAFRFPWSGTPLEAPRLAIQYGADPNGVTLYTSWNGATDHEGFDIFRGYNPTVMTGFDTVLKDGFETEVGVSGLPDNICFFQTRPFGTLISTPPFSNMVFRADLPACRDQLETSFMAVMVK